MSWSDPWTADMPLVLDDPEQMAAAKRYIEKHLSDPADVLAMLGLTEVQT